jgi:hypothetical protein
MCQLADAAELSWVWMPTPAEEPSAVERRLLEAFVGEFGLLPFADMRQA